MDKILKEYKNLLVQKRYSDNTIGMYCNHFAVLERYFHIIHTKHTFNILLITIKNIQNSISKIQTFNLKICQYAIFL